MFAPQHLTRGVLSKTLHRIHGNDEELIGISLDSKQYCYFQDIVTLVNGKEPKGGAWGKTYKSILKMKKVCDISNFALKFPTK